MLNITLALRGEWRAAQLATHNAWAAYCWHRACLWEFQMYDVVAKSMRSKIDKGATPSKKLVAVFDALRRRMLQRVASIPELEVWRDKLTEEREARLVYIDALVRGGGGLTSTGT